LILVLQSGLRLGHGRLEGSQGSLWLIGIDAETQVIKPRLLAGIERIDAQESASSRNSQESLSSAWIGRPVKRW
jgi:hypothetical protein